MVDKITREKVWEKGATIRGKNPNEFRRDSDGNVIRKASYGTQGEYGWEVDHIKPTSKGGHDGLTNLQPLHVVANRKKSDKIG